MKTITKNVLSIIAFISALVIGFIALYLPPTGVIDNSVLWFTAQLLVFTASLLGLNLNLGQAKTSNDSETK